MNKATLKKIGLAAMSGMSDRQIEDDPAGAMRVAQGAMRGALRAAAKPITRFKCVVCGKLTAGRVPREAGADGDLSARFPRRHNRPGGDVCPGVYELAEWVDVE